MNKDKRTVTTDALETLGTIIGPNEKRDAIHLAVEPVVAGQVLRAGEHVTLREGYAYRVKIGEGVGIVDPFLTIDVEMDEMFWLVVYPRQITSLRHVWEHPNFNSIEEMIEPAKAPISEAEQWLRDFCASSDMPSYEIVIAAIKNESLGGNDYDNYYVDKQDSEYWTFHNIDAHCEIPDIFWEKVEIVLGRKLNDNEKTKNFSCTC